MIYLCRNYFSSARQNGTSSVEFQDDSEEVIGDDVGGKDRSPITLFCEDVCKPITSCNVELLPFLCNWTRELRARRRGGNSDTKLAGLLFCTRKLLPGRWRYHAASLNAFKKLQCCFLHSHLWNWLRNVLPTYTEQFVQLIEHFCKIAVISNLVQSNNAPQLGEILVFNLIHFKTIILWRWWCVLPFSSSTLCVLQFMGSSTFIYSK